MANYYQKKSIDINENNVKIFTERFASGVSLSAFTNQLLEKFFKEKLVELDDINFRAIGNLSVNRNTTPTQVVNLILESYEWTIEETPKQRITLDLNKKKVKPLKKVKQMANVITQY